MIPLFSFAADSQQDKLNFKKIYGNEVKPQTYSKIFDFCDKNAINTDSCLQKLKAKSYENQSLQNQTSNKYCCVNVSGFVGEYAYIRGQGYCIPPC